jgi:23S rRNA-/tRNA-specific pseudouridylate synthase
VSDGPGEAGTREIDFDEGLSSRTEFRVLERFADGTTLLEARPLTGRTNQIRVHLWQLGFPICGESVYLPDGKISTETQTVSIDAPPLCLHAWQIEFTHPLTKERTMFSAEGPAWSKENAPAQ